MGPVILGRADIPAGQSLGTPVATSGYGVCFIVLPPAWTDAPLTVQGATEEGAPTSWSDLYDHLGNEVVFVAAASRALALPPTLLLGWRWLRLRSGVAAAPVVQAADRTILLGHRGFA